MNKTFLKELFDEHRKSGRCPSPIVVNEFFNRLLGFLFPEYSTEKYEHFDGFEAEYDELKSQFISLLSKRSNTDSHNDAAISSRFFEALSKIKKSLKCDIQAMYEGDPAAKSVTEVVRTYPGFFAIASYRIAHHLHGEGLILIARIISEHAHSKTGIDIHPGARIGSHFCIDHGTGIVVGETTEIGNFVKLYQGVTLGALSVRKEDASKKRHPIIENHVVIYAGATILGGQTTVGHHSIIGGSVWLTESVPPHSKIYYRAEVNGPQ